MLIQVHHLLSDIIVRNLKFDEALTAAQCRFCFIFLTTSALFRLYIGLVGRAFVMTNTAIPPISLVIIHNLRWFLHREFSEFTNLLWLIEAAHLTHGIRGLFYLLLHLIWIIYVVFKIRWNTFASSRLGLDANFVRRADLSRTQTALVQILLIVVRRLTAGIKLDTF